MSRRSMVHAVLAAAGVLGVCAAVDAGTEDGFSIDVGVLDANGCFGQAACALDGAAVSTTGGVLAKKAHNGAAGFGVSGGPSGGEIDIGETLRVDFDQSRSIIAIKFLFLFNGPEHGDRAEKARVTADGTAYTLSIRNDADDASADWSGPGKVTKCGASTSAGTGCFLVTDPFPGVVSSIAFTAVAGGQPYPPSGGPGPNDSDYSIEFIDVVPQVVVNLEDCADASGCPVASVGGKVAASLSSVEAENPGGSTEAIVIPVRLPDCRYIPHACIDLLPPAGDSAANDDAARKLLIGLGVIKPLDLSKTYRLNPATQLLNVTPLLPAEVSALFDTSGKPPNGLPPLYVSSRWRGQSINDFWFDGLFFKTDAGVVFSETFEGLIDVSQLTGDELGCVANPNDLLAWDVITSVSELARSVGGRHADKAVNVGCENPTKVSGERLSLYTVNFEIVPDTYAPTVKSHKPTITVNNDAVFARLVQSLWNDIGETRARYACRQADPVPSGGAPPLSRHVCKKLATLWKTADARLEQCVKATFYPASANQTRICARARDYVDAFEAVLPESAAGPDVYNRLGELKARVDVFQHVWEERFVKSIKPGGFCREWGTCPP